jgi:hypothetical protein
MDGLTNIEDLIHLIQETGSLGILSLVILLIGFSLLRKIDTLSSHIKNVGYKFEEDKKTSDEIKSSLSSIEMLISILCDRFSNLTNTTPIRQPNKANNTEREDYEPKENH